MTDLDAIPPHDAPRHAGLLAGAADADADGVLRDAGLLPVVLPAEARDAVLELSHVWDGRPDRHPALVYLAGRAPSSRPSRASCPSRACRPSSSGERVSRWTSTVHAIPTGITAIWNQ